MKTRLVIALACCAFTLDDPRLGNLNKAMFGVPKSAQLKEVTWDCGTNGIYRWSSSQPNMVIANAPGTEIAEIHKTFESGFDAGAICAYGIITTSGSYTNVGTFLKRCQEWRDRALEDLNKNYK